MPEAPGAAARLAAALAGLALALVGCSGGAAPGSHSQPAPVTSAAPSPTGAPPVAGARAVVYVAIGASDTVGVGAHHPSTQAWPVVLRDTALPGGDLVNLGVSGSTVRGALQSQVPAAEAADADVVTVWLAVNDLVAGVPVRAYERRLTRLVTRLRGDGHTEVLVGNVPRLWRLPAYRACRAAPADAPCALQEVAGEAAVRALVRDYNVAIRRVVRVAGARLVDLSREVDLAGLVSDDGFHPSTKGHQRIAAAFAQRLPPPLSGR